MTTNEEILLMSHSLTYQSDFLEFYLENPFQNPILWQITWNMENMMIYKNTLFEHKISQENPNIWEISREESFLGVEELLSKKILNIAQEIKKTALPAYFYCKSMGRDGHFYRLTLGDNFTSIAYKWYEVFVPDAWEILNQHTNNLQNIFRNWVGNTKKTSKIIYTEEETAKGFSIFIEQEFLGIKN